MSCDKFKIFVLKENLIDTDKKILELENTIVECKNKNLDASVFENELSDKKYWKDNYLKIIDSEEKKCQLLKLLQTSTYH